jgi:hypothetical protein
MKIEIGKTYRDGWGQAHEVKGFAVIRRAYPGDPNTVYYNDTVWCNTGFWFYTDGRAHYHGRSNSPSNYDLKELVEERHA